MALILTVESMKLKVLVGRENVHHLVVPLWTSRHSQKWGLGDFDLQSTHGLQVYTHNPLANPAGTGVAKGGQRSY